MAPHPRRAAGAKTPREAKKKPSSGKRAGYKPHGSVVYETTEALSRIAESALDANERRRAIFDALARAMSADDNPRPLRADPRAFTTFISRLNRGKRFDAALDVFAAQKALGVERNAVNYNAAMVANVKAEKPEEALKLFDEMREIWHEPSVISFNVAMGACARAGDGARALKLFDEMVGQNMDVDAVSINTAMAAAELVGDEARLEELRAGSHFKRAGDVDEPAPTRVVKDDAKKDSDASDDEDSDDDSDDDSDEGEPEAVADDVGDANVVLSEEEEAKRAAARKRKREIKKKLLAEYAANVGGARDDEDEEMAKRRRKDERRAKFEEKRRARKEATRAKRPWSAAAAHAKKKESKTSKAAKRTAMKADPKVWIEDVPSEDEVLYDDDGERVLPAIKGPSFLDDPNAAKLMNASGGEDFWSVGF